MFAPECIASGDHWWNGSSICSACGARLRCMCGVYVREENFEEHLAEKCRWFKANYESIPKQ